jgi:hypothetical protein
VDHRPVYDPALGFYRAPRVRPIHHSGWRYSTPRCSAAQPGVWHPGAPSSARALSTSGRGLRRGRHPVSAAIARERTIRATSPVDLALRPLPCHTRRADHDHLLPAAVSIWWHDGFRSRRTRCLPGTGSSYLNGRLVGARVPRTATLADQSGRAPCRCDTPSTLA